MTLPNEDKAIEGLTFSDVVQLIRQFYAYDNLGYAEAAKILDRAIEPQVREQAKLARIDELSHLYIYHPQQAHGVIKTDIESNGDEMYEGLYYQDRISALQSILNKGDKS